MPKKRTARLPWYSVIENLNILRDWAQRLVPGRFIAITFTDSVPTGRFCRYRGYSAIEVNPCPTYTDPDGATQPYFKTKNGQWNATRGLLAHEQAHHAFTTTYSAAPGSVLALLVNALEDRRIELLFAAHEWTTTPLFKLLGNKLWQVFRDRRLAEQKAGRTVPDLDLLLNACLYWRWATDRVSNRTFFRVALGTGLKITETWAKIRPEVEAAWTAPDTAAVQTHAERILAILGLPPDANCPKSLRDSEGSHNPYGELEGDGADRPAVARVTLLTAESDEGPAGSEDKLDDPTPDTAASGPDTAGASSADKEALPPGDPLGVIPVEPPDISYDADCEMLPAPYAELVATAEPLAATMLRIPPERTFTVPHEYRGKYSFRREYRTPDRPNQWTVTTGRGGKRAVAVVYDASGSNKFRLPWLRPALMALHLAAVREKYNFSLVACGMDSAPHYTVIQEHNSHDEAGDLARIAGLDAPYGKEYLGWALVGTGKALAAQPERDKEMFVLTDAQLVVSGDWEKSVRWLDNTGDIRVVGILLTDKGAERRDERCLLSMHELFSKHHVISCNTVQLADSLNGLLLR